MKKLSLKILTLNVTVLALSAYPALAVDLLNPLDPSGSNSTTATDPRFIIGRLIKAGLGIIGTISLLIFIYGGWQILFSMGRSEKVKAGRDTMVYAAIGLMVIFASYAIANYVIGGISGAGK